MLTGKRPWLNRFITATCASFDIDLPQVLNRGLHLDIEVLQWSKSVGVWSAQNETKTSLQLTVVTSRADSYSFSQETAARETEGCS